MTSARYGRWVPSPQHGQPRYRTVADSLREKIESGSIPPGALLPAESSLTVEFRASRGTIRQAIAVLREEGLVATEHGRGTYARAIMPALRSAEVQRKVAADDGLAALFGVEVGTPLTERETLILEEGQVQAVVRSYRLALPGSELLGRPI